MLFIHRNLFVLLSKFSRLMNAKSCSPPSKRSRIASGSLSCDVGVDSSRSMEWNNSEPAGGSLRTEELQEGNKKYVIKSQNDKRKYRVITLQNGLTALLISDLIDKESCVVLPNSNSHSEHSDQSEEEEVDDDISSSETEGENEQSHRKKPATKEKSPSEKMAAAALCIGSGSFSDPVDFPGLAHFLEHMVFMGSEKYPEENAFDAFVNKHGGHDNAFTECERTVFYFDINRQFFRQALDHFAQFFISPLMKKDSVDREIQAVDSEFMMAQPRDTCRKQQLFGSFATDQHPMQTFLWGNFQTLKTQPLENNMDIYQTLREFHKRMYSSDYMTLTVQSKETLDTLEQWVKQIFSDVPRNEMRKETFHHLAKPFNTTSFHKLYKIIPVKDTHQLELTWALPSLLKYYRSKPLHYIGWLVGHEGKGSLLSYLKSKCWALSVASGNGETGFEHNQTCSTFTITLTLTDQGFHQVYQVLTAIFEYLEMLRHVGPSQRVFEEIQTIENNEFRWQEQSDPIDYVDTLCENMQLYPPEHYLTGDQLLFDYDPQVIDDCQKLLVPQKANVMILSKKFEEEGNCDLREKWFGTQYSVSEFDPTWEAKWSNLAPGSWFHLPEPNTFIATDFTLKHTDTEIVPEGFSVVPPVKILDIDCCRLWFKPDRKFKVPKAYLYFFMVSPVVNETPKSMAMFDLFVELLTQNLSEVAYAADVAQLDYSFQVLEKGLVIKIHGFNHKLPKLFETIVDHIADFKVESGMFDIVKQQLIRSYYNRFIKPSRLVREVRLATLLDTYHMSTDRQAGLQEVSKEMLLDFVNQFKSQIYVEGYVHGNFKEEEAVSLQKYISSRIDCSLARKSLPKVQVTELPQAKHCLCVKSFNEKDSNSVVTNYYQHGPANMRQAALNEVLEMMMEEPCFNFLRTTEQLGYSVYTTNQDTSAIVGLSVTVQTQATKFSMQLVNSKIEDFLRTFRQNLKETTPEQFSSRISSLITSKRCEDNHIGEEADRHWTEIEKERYLFNKLNVQITELQKVSLVKVCDWFEALMLASTQKKLSVQVVGSDKLNTEGKDQDVKKLNTNDSVMDTTDSKRTVFNLECLHSEMSDHKHITDIHSFKEDLKCRSYITVKVQLKVYFTCKCTIEIMPMQTSI